MTDELIDVPLSSRAITFINERLRLDRKRRQQTDKDPIKEIPVPNTPETIVKLTIPQITFINNRLAKNRRTRESDRLAKKSKTSRGPTVKDPILEIKLQMTGTVTIVTTPAQTSPDNSPPRISQPPIDHHWTPNPGLIPV